ncbi:competence type IV pilus minor pilin ComGF [Virgibacillus proomii]|jgi:competence protein ComGF|uniref:competence type IV pilus minor pilin ComGF n=1 Tax=Virgibacillus proomii TaxID=84407 RepID=UPI0009851404|nr:ComGF family competence protein [Virgibacillus proomii]
MQSSDKKKFVYMAFYSKEGFTFITTLLMMGILVISLPFLSYLIQVVTERSDQSELSVGQFFLFMRNEVMQAKQLQVYPNKLKLTAKDGATASFELYQQLIRRQVDGKGHEIYLRDIQRLQFISLPYGVRLMVTTIEGEQFEKEIIFYQ